MFLCRYLFFYMALYSSLFAAEAILEIDSGGHTGVVKKLIVTKDKNIITCSNDKTIKVWSNDGKLLRRIDGQIGDGDEGKIYAIALSPDEKYLAVGGYMATFNGENYLEVGAIRLYDYKSGKLITLLRSHKDIINDLSFSSDGRYLVSASSDNTVKLWDMSSYSLARTINFHTNQVYAVRLANFAGNDYVISAGYDKKIASHHISGKLMNSYSNADKLSFLAIKSDEIAACGFGKRILIFDNGLDLKRKIYSTTVPAGLSYSPDGRYLITGAQANPLNIDIYDTDNNHSRITTFNKNTSLSMAVGFQDNTTAISCGGSKGEIYIWDAFSKNIKTSIMGKGGTVWSVGINGNEIAWGNNARNSHNDQSWNVSHSINLQTKNITAINNQSRFYRIDSNGLSHSMGGEYGYSDAVLYVSSSGKSITKNSANGIVHRCYGWWSEYIISGGTGDITIYDKNGASVANLIGHTGDVWTIALEGDRLVSGGDDQTIRVWDLAPIRNGVKELKPTVNIFVGSDNEWAMWTPDGFFDASTNGAKYIGYHVNRGADKEAEFVGVDKLYNAFYRPDLVQKALAGESLAEYAKNINIQKLLDGGLAPRVAIKTDGGKSDTRDREIKLEVCDKGGGYDNLTLTLNDMPVSILDKNRAIKLKQASKYDDVCFEFSPLISLQGGDNIIGFKATNKTGTIESNTAQITLSYKNTVAAKPNLHILTIGVDKYRDGDLQLKYSVADARELGKSIKSASKNLFGNVYSYELIDAAVTKENIINKFAEIGAKTTREDVFVLYIAGHGITDKLTGAYFYLPSDFRYNGDESVRNKGISQEDFKLALSKIQAMKSITLIDTCNSGSFAEALASRGILQKTAIDKLTRATGRATLVASSKDQVALEGFEGHGVFTYTLMEALGGKAYKDGKITIKQLASYVEDVLPERTYKKWGYEQIPQSNITGTDFPIGAR